MNLLKGGEKKSKKIMRKQRAINKQNVTRLNHVFHAFDDTEEKARWQADITSLTFHPCFRNLTHAFYLKTYTSLRGFSMKRMAMLGGGAVTVLLLGLTGCANKKSSAKESTSGLQRIHFDFDQSNNKSNFEPVLRNKAAWAQSHNNKKIVIEGHCDNRGSVECNNAQNLQMILATGKIDAQNLWRVNES